MDWRLLYKSLFARAQSYHRSVCELDTRVSGRGVEAHLGARCALPKARMCGQEGGRGVTRNLGRGPVHDVADHSGADADSGGGLGEAQRGQRLRRVRRAGCSGGEQGDASVAGESALGVDGVGGAVWAGGWVGGTR
jgi:hypothetical protein